MSSVASRPDVTGTAERLSSGERFAGVLFDDGEQRALALEALLGKVVDDDTRLVWVGNPLRSPLTIERFLIQIIGPEIDFRIERGPAELAQLIATPVRTETRLLIVVQQPETINAETLHLLIQMGWYLADETMQVQFLFAGTPAFVIPRIAKPDASPFPPICPEQEPETPVPGPRKRDVLPLILLLLSTALGGLISLAPVSLDAFPDYPAAGATPALPEVPTLRREFDVFLAQRNPPLPPMNDRERTALFNELLAHQRRE